MNSYVEPLLMPGIRGSLLCAVEKGSIQGKEEGDSGHLWRVPRDKKKKQDLTELVHAQGCGDV